jgi:hypothetical protein
MSWLIRRQPPRASPGDIRARARRSGYSSGTIRERGVHGGQRHAEHYWPFAEIRALEANNTTSAHSVCPRPRHRASADNCVKVWDAKETAAVQTQALADKHVLLALLRLVGDELQTRRWHKGKQEH